MGSLVDRDHKIRLLVSGLGPKERVEMIDFLTMNPKCIGDRLWKRIRANERKPGSLPSRRSFAKLVKSGVGS